MAICYVCLKHSLEEKKAQDREPATFRCRCTRCGTYDVANKLIAGEQNGATIDGNARLPLSHAIRSATDAHGRFVEVIDYETFRRAVEQHPLPDALEQADIFVDSIARRSSFGEQTTKESTEAWLARLGLKGGNQLANVCLELKSWIDDEGAVAGDNQVSFMLTFDGWKRAREIRNERGPGNQAFVAMWFSPEMNASFDEGFAPALETTGYKPYRVDRDAHNVKIDDKIIAEIRRSKLVIVDATGSRPNAYFEAGFTMGLGIPAIWCCCDSPTAPGVSSGAWTDNLPFDIRQHPFIFWTTPAGLREKLTARIRALGFDAAWNQAQ
ncbi:MAG TPA: hypothetical protein VJU61_10810 [Polyangiaceae bacterium]|nr:hypothetical protein [Polyangiaceae bacterium]